MFAWNFPLAIKNCVLSNWNNNRLCCYLLHSNIDSCVRHQILMGDDQSLSLLSRLFDSTVRRPEYFMITWLARLACGVMSAIIPHLDAFWTSRTVSEWRFWCLSNLDVHRKSMSTYFHLTSPDKGLFLVVRHSGQTHMFSHASDFYFKKNPDWARICDFYFQNPNMSRRVPNGCNGVFLLLPWSSKGISSFYLDS